MTATADTTPPDWTTLTDDVTCPLCAYDLRGLTDPRCPECGYAFTWPALLDARRTIHPYLFEHHPERNASSFFRTLTAGVLPRRFWRTLTPLHAVRPRRLVTYWLVVVLLSLPAVVLPIWEHAASYRAAVTAQRAMMFATYGSPTYAWYRAAMAARFGSLQRWIDQVAPSQTWRQALVAGWPEGRACVFFWACFALWPATTVAVLAVYRRSTRQAAVRAAQVARCCVYAADGGACLGVALVPVLAYGVWLNQTGGGPRFAFEPIVAGLLNAPAAVWTLVLLVATYRLTVAYSRYLHMRRAWLAVPLAQVIVALLYVELYVLLIGVSAR